MKDARIKQCVCMLLHIKLQINIQYITTAYGRVVGRLDICVCLAWCWRYEFIMICADLKCRRIPVEVRAEAKDLI
jgi:exonuclease I